MPASSKASTNTPAVIAAVASWPRPIVPAATATAANRPSTSAARPTEGPTSRPATGPPCAGGSPAPAAISGPAGKQISPACEHRRDPGGGDREPLRDEHHAAAALPAEQLPDRAQAPLAAPVAASDERDQHESWQRGEHAGGHVPDLARLGERGGGWVAAALAVACALAITCRHLRWPRGSQMPGIRGLASPPLALFAAPHVISRQKPVTVRPETQVRGLASLRNSARSREHGSILSLRQGSLWPRGLFLISRNLSSSRGCSTTTDSATTPPAISAAFTSRPLSCSTRNSPSVCRAGQRRAVAWRHRHPPGRRRP